MCVNILFIATVCEVEWLLMLIRHTGIVGEKIPNNVQMEMASGKTFDRIPSLTKFKVDI